MLALKLIERKRDRQRIEPAEWRSLIAAYVTGDIPDYQMAALLMAAYLNGLDTDETVALTSAMMSSGATLPKRGGPRIDKHSTGGVGDKTSLVLAPLMASAGLTVPMISGRGLGHTGGTLDKLEAIPGFRTNLTLEEASAQLDRLGCVLIGQTAELAPADRRLYALRDATATVDSIPLIAASIMSKKLVEGLDGLVLNVTTGPGAFFPTREDALALARTMISLGAAHDCRTVAVLTAMDRPLGWACGNALETEEAIHALHGEGPPDLMAVTYALGVEMLRLGGLPPDVSLLENAISSGAAAQKFAEIISAQGGNPGVVDDPATLPQTPLSAPYVTRRSGFIARINPRIVGQGIIQLGGGRTRQEDLIDPAVGFVITAKPGDRVDQGRAIATIYARDDAGLASGRETLDRAIVIAEEPAPMLSLILDRIGA